MIFKDRAYPYLLQLNLDSLREDTSTCDLTLVSEGKQFHVHRFLLAAISPYFRNLLLNCQFKESKEKKITLNGITSKALEGVVSFVYTSTVEINNSNVHQLLEACEQFQLSSLKIQINRYLNKTLLCNRNYLSYYAIAKRYRMFSLKKKAFRLCLANFPSISCDRNFQLINFDVIFDIVSSQLLVGEEFDVLQAIINWVQYDVTSRLIYLKNLLHCVYLNAIPTEKSKEASDWVVHEQVALELNKFLKSEPSTPQQDSSHKLLPEPTIIFNSDVRYHSEKKVIISIGGITNSYCTRAADCLIKDYSEWTCTIPRFFSKWTKQEDSRVIAPMRCNREDAAIAYDEQRIFVAGGCQSTEEPLAECEVYDFPTNKWRALPDLPELLRGTRGVLCEGQFIVSGGLSNGGATNKMWRLDEKRLCWIQLPSLPQSRYSHGFACYSDSLFVIGGYTQDSEDKIPSNVCYRLDEWSQKWCEMAPMPMPKASFGCVAISHYIYTLGGINDNDEVVASVERYDIFEDKWSSVTSMPVPRACFGITTKNGRIYCLGGKDFRGYLHTVDYLNTANERWQCVNAMQVAKCGMGAATIQIPVLEDVKQPTLWISLDPFDLEE